MRNPLAAAFLTDIVQFKTSASFQKHILKIAIVKIKNTFQYKLKLILSIFINFIFSYHRIKDVY